jgi:hypothetical protein
MVPKDLPPDIRFEESPAADFSATPAVSRFFPAPRP